jgi:hypothetical protein
MKLLACELTGADRNAPSSPDWPDLGTVKGIAPFGRLVANAGEIPVDCQTRVRVRLEPIQLRMVGVAASLPAKDGLGQQGFTLQGDQPCRIEVFGVKRPKTH